MEGEFVSVTREDAIAAYRLILGRDPENEAVVVEKMGSSNLNELRDSFLRSQEFANSYPMGTVGRFLEVESLDLDPSCTPEQLQAMVNRIAKSWKQFGESEPHWSVLTGEEFKQENLAANIAAFYQSGVGSVRVMLNMLRRAGLPVKFGKVLDFGCGVGRLTLALTEYADSVTGIDISPPHLKLARERAKEVGIDNAEFESISTVDDLDKFKGYDLVLSLIVLQHNPPPVMAAIYRKLLDALNIGGVAIVQMPTYLQGQFFHGETYLEAEPGIMEMHSLPQKVIFDIIDEAGCRPIEVREDMAIGTIGLSHTFAVQKVR